MKKLLIISLSFVLLSSFFWLPSAPSETPSKKLAETSTGTPAEKGINFQNITFDQAIGLAKKENKNVFMNVYATWCGPCMNLQKTTFKSDKVGVEFNKTFVNISVNAEKGEGIALSKKYNVEAHPLMLIISPDGKVQKRILGYVKENQLLTEVGAFLK